MPDATSRGGKAGCTTGSARLGKAEMIIRKAQAPADPEAEARAEHYGASERLRYSEAGGSTQFGAHVEMLQQGSRSSVRHWHDEEDRFLYVISGERP